MDGISRMVKLELLPIIRGRCWESSKKNTDLVFDEFVALAGHHRKRGIRLLRKSGVAAEKLPRPVANQESTPMRDFLVPQSTQIALVAGRPFLRVTAWTSFDPVLALHFKQYISGASGEVVILVCSRWVMA